ncbi:uncharacterized protein SRS1_21023 [Sporisorium reilianum f. sp. reilianum]|uniref:Pyridoxamine 5'-phosphate oxidase putative domain-containing protein n=1 Tax=Sporisorium reilianum f. sp. reilianum TaxID=72559 RepID=A0A2N8UKR0_9BASI|nr:uncharacterized protein SRS1_21023 [Sporisorium reilianum f. sp. reilianum]
MGKFYDHIPEHLHKFMLRQRLFFVATAPLHGGSVNVSPKANEGAFELTSAHRVRYADLTGSGNETISHLLEPGNGRITLAFINIEEGAPNIVRLYGKGTVFERASDAGFDQKWRDEHGGKPVPIGVRAIIDVAVHTCATSCGYSLPVFHFQRKRTVLDDYHSKYDRPGGMEALQRYKGATYPSIDAEGIVVEKDHRHGGSPHIRRIGSALELYWALCNTLSIDGLPGMRSVAPLMDEQEQQRLLTRAKQHNAWQAPPDDLGPIKSLPMMSSQTGEREAPGRFINLAQPVSILHVSVAFAAGCILTALFLAAHA